MKIKSAISMIMAGIFTVAAVLGFLVLACTVEIHRDGVSNFLLYWAAWLGCVILAVLFYDYRIIVRHFYACYCGILLLHGYIHKKRSKDYMFLYKAAIETKSVSKFYGYMLHVYDYFHRKDI